MREIKTNYDMVRNMSLEEMAVFLENEDELCTLYCNNVCCEYHSADGDEGSCAAFKKGIKNPCVKAVCKWLESEAAEDGKCEKI